MTDYAVKGTVLQFTSASTAFVAVGQIKSIDQAPGFKMGQRDATHLGSAIGEPRPTIGRPQVISGTMVYSNKDDAARVAATRVVTPSTIFDTALGTPGLDEFKIILPTTTLFWRNYGFFTDWTPTGGDEEGTWMAKFEIQLASTVTAPTS
jgi:hypothetical protein